MTFVDASSLYALLDTADPNHARVVEVLERLRAADAQLVTLAYVVVEVVALVQRRLGLEVVRRLIDDLLPIIDVVHVDAPLHAEAVAALLAAGRPGISLVDRVSFLVMRRHGTEVAFTFDDDFAGEGFRGLPGS